MNAMKIASLFFTFWKRWDILKTYSAQLYTTKCSLRV